MRHDLLRKICIVWLTLFATAAVAAEGKTARPDPLLELEADRFRLTAAADVDAAVAELAADAALAAAAVALSVLACSSRMTHDRPAGGASVKVICKL